MKLGESTHLNVRVGVNREVYCKLFIGRGGDKTVSTMVSGQARQISSSVWRNLPVILEI